MWVGKVRRRTGLTTLSCGHLFKTLPRPFTNAIHHRKLPTSQVIAEQEEVTQEIPEAREIEIRTSLIVVQKLMIPYQTTHFKQDFHMKRSNNKKYNTQRYTRKHRHQVLCSLKIALTSQWTLPNFSCFLACISTPLNHCMSQLFYSFYTEGTPCQNLRPISYLICEYYKQHYRN